MTDTVKTPDQAAIKFVQFMRRRAIAQCSRSFPDPGFHFENTGRGILECCAVPGPVTCDDVQTYRTSFKLDSRAISALDAELAAMGVKLEGESQ